MLSNRIWVEPPAISLYLKVCRNATMDDQWQLDRQRTSGTSSSRFSLARNLIKRDSNGGNESVDGAKGPYGLTTLVEPLEVAIADLVFVHGLAGGSESTWSKSMDPDLFWPKEWLPRDPDFRDVRIHSFGYNSNWSKDSTLNIHDFAKSLLASIQDCPAMRDSNVCRTHFLQRASQYEHTSRSTHRTRGSFEACY